MCFYRDEVQRRTCKDFFSQSEKKRQGWGMLSHAQLIYSLLIGSRKKKWICLRNLYKYLWDHRYLFILCSNTRKAKNLFVCTGLADKMMSTCSLQRWNELVASIYLNILISSPCNFSDVFVFTQLEVYLYMVFKKQNYQFTVFMEGIEIVKEKKFVSCLI